MLFLDQFQYFFFFFDLKFDGDSKWLAGPQVQFHLICWALLLMDVVLLVYIYLYQTFTTNSFLSISKHNFKTAKTFFSFYWLLTTNITTDLTLVVLFLCVSLVGEFLFVLVINYLYNYYSYLGSIVLVYDLGWWSSLCIGYELLILLLLLPR